ncbi:cytochrome P450 monooxygenase-like protein 40 [Elsinoe australis]|uniref:Cytochrome P450 monooxygenase-like protein 40 n=1 Tax=Elsinoe australis TaxID=40998 RepID=A0A4U7AQE4_9PEZI|nr:cytochrome P450 monooxygenase-like protein 40 [Elsinoe australis]
MDGLLSTNHEPLNIALGIVGIIIAAKIFDIIYAICLHPLRKIPGPWYTKASRLPYGRRLLDGSSVVWLQELHRKYGPVVRYTPNEISVINGDIAWQEIYGFRTGKQKGVGSFLKDRVWYAPPMDGVPSLIMTNDADHSRQRRILSHAFSEKSMRNQEPLIQRYADLLISRLKETDVAAGKPADLTQWYNWTTFDIIADLTFGAPFGCLAQATTHKYVNLLLSSIKAFSLFYLFHYFPALQQLRKYVVKSDVIKLRQEWTDFVKSSTHKRIEAETERHDFMTDILAKQRDEEEKGHEGITTQEITSNANLLLVAGTETTATTLTGTTYLMLKHPEVYQKLKDEVRGRFKSQDEISIEAAGELSYTLAVLNESMRYMPPVPAGFVRKVPQEGAEVSGYWLPGNCNASISVSQYPAYHSDSNFRDPELYAPERWLGDPKYKDDNRATFSPFSFGPRNCLGKNLAYAEMRVILAKMIFNFDFELQEDSTDWFNRLDVRTLWTKPALNVKLTAVH